MIFSHRVEGFGTCATCKTPLFLAVRHDTPDGAGFWCPRCGQQWRDGNSRPITVEPGSHDLARGTILFAYEGLLFPDGTMTWRARVEGATHADVDRMASSLGHLLYAARTREEHLRGADRWVFRRENDAFFGRYHDTDVALIAYTAGKRRGVRLPLLCEVCGRDIKPGSKGYRCGARRGIGAWVAWSEIRFCAGCVEAAPVATARAHLRVIGGGA